MNRDLNIPQNRVGLSREAGANDHKPADFVRDMTHELRTPLNAIIGLCQCLERDREAPLNETQRDAVTRIERNAHALLDSANQLLVRIRNGKC
jgi:signal transduction histidine kinase